MRSTITFSVGALATLTFALMLSPFAAIVVITYAVRAWVFIMATAFFSAIALLDDLHSAWHQSSKAMQPRFAYASVEELDYTPAMVPTAPIALHAEPATQITPIVVEEPVTTCERFTPSIEQEAIAIIEAVIAENMPQAPVKAATTVRKPGKTKKDKAMVAACGPVAHVPVITAKPVRRSVIDGNKPWAIQMMEDGMNAGLAVGKNGKVREFATQASALKASKALAQN